MKKETIVALAIVLLVAGIVIFLHKRKINSVTVNAQNLMPYDTRNRTVDQLLAQANWIQEMHRMHGISLTKEELEELTRRFLALEKDVNSNDALRQIETSIAEDGRLTFGAKYGLY